MKKFSIIGVAIIIGLIFVWLIVRNTGSISQEITDTGKNISVLPPALDVKVPANDTATGNVTKPITNLDTKKVMSASINTNKGDITIEFFDSEAPNTVANFIKLAGEHFYDTVKFHRVIKGFMIQGGDPLTKDNTKIDMWGTGGPGYSFADEIDPHSALYVGGGYKKGIVAMANSGPNTNGSQFFIMTADYPLPPLYTIFGKVVSGQDVVDKIAVVATTTNDRPVEPVIINSVIVK